MLNSHKNIAFISGLVVLLLIHAGLLFSQQLGKSQSRRQSVSDAIPQFGKNLVQTSLESLASLSTSFGIEPTNPALAEKTAEKVDNLSQTKAALVAVTEQGDLLFAKVSLQEQGKPRMVTLRIGDTVMGYRLSELNLTAAVFVKDDHKITLHMFKRDNTNVAAN